MELTFSKTACQCLRKAVSKIQTQEQTQEVRLTDSMPDIGRVLGSWGQVLIRSKEWRGSAMAVSGGVMAWVLYAPEDGSAPVSMESWIPFQMHWEFPQTERDCIMNIVPLLRSVDGRSTSARKLMIRANVSVLGQAYEPIEPESWMPENVPEDLQLLKASYPMELPKEAGEKQFQVDEELTLPDTYPEVQKLLRYALQPKILEQKVMAGRLVFRGKGDLKMLYADPDGAIHSWECEVPFSQYAELDRDYGPNSAATIMPMLTNLELMPDEQRRLQLKCGLCGQYVVYDREMVEIAEDAYSPQRQVKTQMQELKMPLRLDRKTESMRTQQQLTAPAERVVDVCWLADHPQHRQNADTAVLAVPGQFQVLYYDNAGMLQSGTARGEELWQIPSDPMNKVEAYVQLSGYPVADVNEQGIALTAQWEAAADVFSEQGLPMLTQITLGEKCEKDPNRPSLILRKAGEQRLWDIARECGSTVDAIMLANNLEDQPEADRILLIPVS
ncbi:MAG: DUF3794 domain-containing protein [Oscillospiraceae bacterium]|nr:DUF3794 domain-containing protein [Oscillospiraceae bacterium]